MDSIRSRCFKLLKTKFVRLLCVCFASILLVFVLAGAAITKYLVIIEDGDTKAVIYTSQGEPQAILDDEGVALTSNDTYTFSGFADGKATIKINRAKKVTIKADAKENTVFMIEGTVADALSNAKVSVVDDDLINVSLTENIVDNMNIVINRVVMKEIITQKEIPADSIKVPTPLLQNGRRSVLYQGTNGLNETKVLQTIIDGEVVEEKQISSEVIKKPISSTVLVGDSSATISEITPRQSITLDAKGNPVNYKSKVVGKATAYSTFGRRTALKPGNVAMELSGFPKGTRLYIKTPDGSFVYGYSVVKDTGTAVSDGRVLVDLFFDSYKESCLFGAKNVEIYIL